ncbi:MAG: MOSC domain-containing protein [Polaribacter sp.]|uniref:MOSC domain-containing protein n=1 Tax=Polaribacter sp. TaxID=1920175 RepID=UPI002F355210
MKIVSTNIGERKIINWKGTEIVTGIFKYTVNEPIFLDTEDVKGDTICNRENHGGILQAIYGYSLKHYGYFKKMHPNLDFEMGIFGENLTLDDLDETKIHQGDTFKVGEAVLEATIPRNPCLKLGVRFNDMKIVKQFWNSTFCGVYFKVIKTGFVKIDDVFEQIKSCPENPTIADLYVADRTEKGL